MATAGPDTSRRRISLTKTQVQTPAGAELLLLCREITADGKVTNEEVRDLEAWLARNASVDLPAVAFLRETFSAVLEHGGIDQPARRKIAEALERVLPTHHRSRVRLERLYVEQCDRNGWDANVDGRSKYEFHVVSVKHSDRIATIREHVRVGEPAELVRAAPSARYRNNIEVRPVAGPMIGYVPELLANEMVPLLDRGYGYAARFTNVLECRDTSLIPVVAVRFFSKSERNPAGGG